jgi:hypothetical protein
MQKFNLVVLGAVTAAAVAAVAAVVAAAAGARAPVPPAAVDPIAQLEATESPERRIDTWSAE